MSLVTHTPLVLKKTLEDETQNVLYSIHDVAFLFIFPGGGGKKYRHFLPILVRLFFVVVSSSNCSNSHLNY